uniref:Uncharacterized protein AlNc14C636G12307 n=1 Tax=Albugo laibachii Nc14 TaxID=890382 RepID=F0X1K2_9STRA|nr:conserved hypothetical protein [Albugo laibachii Nc14]|eukprot:CCA27694.1 conserved hypothetical protein [Albugo laibachii Nc14]
MEGNRPSGKPQSRGGRGRNDNEDSIDTLKGANAQEFIPAAHKSIDQQRVTRNKAVEGIFRSKSRASYKKLDVKNRNNASQWRGACVSTDQRISRYKETISPCKVLIRNIPPSVTLEEMRVILAPYNISCNMIWRFVAGKTRMNERPCVTGRMYLDYKGDNVKAAELITSLNGFAIESNQKDSKRTLEVAYAPSRRLPGDRRRRDPKVGEIFNDPAYLEFIEALDAPAQKPSIDSTSQEAELIEQPIPAVVQFLNEKKGRERLRKGNAFEKKRPTTRHFRKSETKKSKFTKSDTQNAESKEKTEKPKTRKSSRRQESKSELKSKSAETNSEIDANKTEAIVKASRNGKTGTHPKHNDNRSEKTRKKIFAPKARPTTEPQSLLV